MHVSGLSDVKRKVFDKLCSPPSSKKTKLDVEKFEEFSRVTIFEPKRRINTQNLLQQKKLILLLDLDHTLLNAVSCTELSINEDYLLYTPSHKRKITIWKNFIIKLRPYVHTFLSEANKLFDLYICTMAIHEYALKMAELLDPQGIYFNSSKIISRGDFKASDQKDLGPVLGEERMVVILDDSVNVWKGYKDSLIVMSRYNYFAESHKMYEGSGYSLCEMKEDEDELDGALALTLYVLRRIHRMFFEGGSCKDVRRIMKMIGEEVENNGGCGMDVNGKLMDDQRWVVGII